MKAGYGLIPEQIQKLQLTPALLQSIKVLQLSSAELESYIEEQITANPVLEIKDDTGKYSTGSFGLKNSGGLPYEKEDLNSISLKEHLIFQLHFEKLSQSDEKLCRQIIDSLDDNGYLIVSAEEFEHLMGKRRSDINKAIEKIQSFDPPGVCARSIGECLKLQLKAKGKETDIKEKIIDNCLEMVAANRLAAIAKKLHVSTDEVQKAVCDIKSLDPKPGRAFMNQEETRYVTPDVYIEREENRYKVLLSESRLPRVGVSDYYVKVFTENSKDKELSDYLNDKIHAANRLISAIEQRNATIFNVAAAIVKYQEDFFDFGNKYLRPLSLKTIAGEVGLHESTVSRTINGKYMDTPRGFFEFKYFFSLGVHNEYGEGVSSKAVKAIISELVEEEDKSHPLSDKNITEILIEKGINISRRTVAKYRDEAGILSSTQRKIF